MKKLGAAAYGRTSSKANAHGSSTTRQMKAAKATAKALGIKKVKEVCEVLSGSLPLPARKMILDLIETHDCVLVESARALARDADVGEQIYKAAKRAGTKLIASDMPTLLKNDPSPTETFLRRVMWAYFELERSLVVDRLAKGRIEAMKKSKKTTATGSVKVVGRNSVMDRVKGTPMEALLREAAKKSNKKSMPKRTGSVAERCP